MKSASITRTDKGSLFVAAEKVFSKSLVKMISEQGHDFLEGLREGAYVFDESGNRYLDCYTSAGTFNLGRKNSTIAASLKKALYETDQGNFVMPSQEKALLARRICRFMPGNLDCVLFGVTRGESMEAALKLARGFTGHSGIVTVDSGCYGESGFALSVSERKGKEQFGALIPDVRVVPFGDVAAARSAAESKPAAFVMEPIQAENHCRTASNDYYAEVRSPVRPAWNQAHLRRNPERVRQDRAEILLRAYRCRAGYPDRRRGHNRRYIPHDRDYIYA